jgi:predicted dehydrogenase
LTYSAVLIGLGKMGFGYGDTSLPNAWGLSHFSAIQRSTSFQLKLCIDNNPETLKNFESAYGITTSQTVATFPGLSPDLVIIATPIDTHLNMVREVVKWLKPKIIILEKPAARNFKEVQDILRITSNCKIPVILNYPRRYSEGAIEVKEMILSKKIQIPAQSLIRCVPDLLNNGIHFLDLMEFWFGKLAFDKKNYQMPKKSSYHFSNKDVEIHFIESSPLPYSHYSIDILFQNGRLEVGPRDFGFLWHPIVNDIFYDGHFVISEKFEKYEMRINDLQNNLLTQIAEWLDGKRQDIYTLEDSLNNYKILFQATRFHKEYHE